MFEFRDFCRAFRRAAVCLSLFAAAALPVLTQTPASNSAPQSPNASASLGEELDLGVIAYRNAHYDEAVAHFQKAADLNPTNFVAQLYLGTALAQNVVPGLTTPENLKTAEQSIEAFKKALEIAPHQTVAMAEIAGVYFAIKKLDEARTWQMRVLDENPTDADAAYMIGVIDWTEAHQNVLKALLSAGLADDGEGNINAPAEVMTAIAEQNRPLVEEGLKYLNQALQDRPDYSDAMAYLSFLYSRKADLDRDNKSVLEDDLAQGNEWMRKAIETRKANEEKKTESAQPAQP